MSEPAARPAASNETTPTPSAQPATGAAATMNLGGLATCEPTAPVNAAIDRMAKLADTNGDGEVSQEEATGLANFTLGGAFFRADANGDGTVTPEEGREVRKDLVQRFPELEAIVMAARASGQKTFTLSLGSADMEYGKPLSLAEVRTAAKALVDDLFGFADKNKNGSIGVEEARMASREGLRAAARVAFDTMDADRDGTLKYEEMQQLVEVPLRKAFDLADGDRNQRLSVDEAAAALSLLSRTVSNPQSLASPPTAAAKNDGPNP